jgi:hypothetical protein
MPDATIGVLNETVAATTYITPFADPQPALIAFLARAAVPGARVRVMIYGCTWEPFYEAMANAKKAGADVKIIFDHTQSAGPKEHQHIEWLRTQGFVDGADFIIGTSPVHRQIVHLKRTAITLPDGSAWVERGSLNYSDSAFMQLNDVTIEQSPANAKYTDMAFDYLWQWILLHEQVMQLTA